MTPIRDNYYYTYISTATTTQINNSLPTKLVRIILTETAAGAITVYNEIGSGTTDVVSVLKASVVEQEFCYGITLKTGLKIVTAAASKLTVVWATI